MDYSLPDSSAHEIFQARILEWVASSDSRGSSWPGVEPTPPASTALAQILHHWAICKPWHYYCLIRCYRWLNIFLYTHFRGFSGGTSGTNVGNVRDPGSIPGLGRSPGKDMAWRTSWTEEPGRPQSIGSHRVRRDWSRLCVHTHTHFNHLGNFFNGLFLLELLFCQ